MKSNTVTNRVVTITLNPALDLTGSLGQLAVGSVNLVDQGSLHAAGKGVNVAKVLSDLGAQVTVTGFLGRNNDAAFCQLFSDMGAEDALIRIDGATRINVKLVEQTGEVSDINFPGIEVPEEAVIAFEKHLFSLAKTHQYFVLAGSLPKGVSPELCATWVESLQKMGKQVILDSSRAALALGLTAQPWLIKPNEQELAELVGHELKDVPAYQQAVVNLVNKGINNVVVSLGSRGVIWLQGDQQNEARWHYAQPPKMQVVSTVGAGDTLVAGLCWGHMQGWQAERTLTFSTALSALAVAQVGVGVPCIEAVQAVLKKVTQHKPSV